jgi:hypothetical protein
MGRFHLYLVSFICSFMVIVSSPHSQRAWASPFGQDLAHALRVRPDRKLHSEQHSVLAAYLVMERLLLDDSDWFTFINALPTRMDDMPLMYVVGTR